MVARRALVAAAVVLLLGVSASGCTSPPPAPERAVWAFGAVQVTDLADEGWTGRGVTVAILDTGIETEGPYMGGVSVTYWEDLVNGEPDPYDDNGHGTAMASILVGRGDLAGGAPGVDLVVIKVIAADGSGSDNTVAMGISHAVSAGADIISLSLGGGSLPILGSASTQAAESAVAAGVFVVASAGNDGGADDDGQVAAPGVSRDAISVGAVDRDFEIAPFSSVGRAVLFPPSSDPNRKPEVVAPGVEIEVAWTGGQAATVSGTSPAAVFVSAGLALLLGAHPDLVRQDASTVTEVKQAIMDSAMAVGGQQTPHDNYYGYGLFRAASAEALL